MSTATVGIKERPVIFSGAMVRALINGRKFQTRRVLRVQPPDDVTEVFNWQDSRIPKAQKADEGCYYTISTGPEHQGLFFLSKCPYGQPGERLWVRETLQRGPSLMVGDLSANTMQYAATLTGVPFAEGAEIGYCGKALWQWPDKNKRPSIFMPRWASRITLEITDVRVERVQDISEDDAVAEGVQPTIYTQEDIEEIVSTEPPESEARQLMEILGPGQITAKFNYLILWDEINAKRGYSWAANPFVWVITFRRL